MDDELPHLDELRQELAFFFPNLTYRGYAGQSMPLRPLHLNQRNSRDENSDRARNKPGREGANNDFDSKDEDKDDNQHTQQQQHQQQQFAGTGPRLQSVLERSQAVGRWRRTWQSRQPQGSMALMQPPSTSSPRMASLSSPVLPLLGPPSLSARRKNSKTALPLPPLPPPLAPCLQCVLAGACCSLTTTPYARDYVNDRVEASRMPAGVGVPAKTAATRITAALWKTEHARLVRAVDRLLKTRKKKSSSSASSSPTPDWAALKAVLARRRQQLEQRVLRRAVARGECDAPFLALPPARCGRCVREGETACLQQSADMTADGGAMIVESAWFASSGPPPASLLPQHCRTLLEQMSLLPFRSGNSYHHRHRYSGVPRSPMPPLRLEAIFCRDPAVLSAPAVAAKAQRLLARIVQKHKQQQTLNLNRQQRAAGGTMHYLRALADRGGGSGSAVVPLPLPRPATPRELTRRLPQRSTNNVYAGRGVATAALTYGAGPALTAAGGGGVTTTDNNTDKDSTFLDVSVFAPAPPPIPSWHGNKNNKLNGDDRPAQQQQSAAYGREEYFLDVGENRMAATMRKQQQQLRRWQRRRKSPAADSTTSVLRPASLLTPAPVVAPAPLLADEYTRPAEPRHQALLQEALAAYRAAHPVAEAAADTAGTADDTADGAAVDPFFLQAPPLPPSPTSPTSGPNTRNHRPWSKEQTAAMLRERLAAATDGVGGAGGTDGGDGVVGEQQLQAWADWFGVSLQRLAEHRRLQQRKRRQE